MAIHVRQKGLKALHAKVSEVSAGQRKTGKTIAHAMLAVLASITFGSPFIPAQAETVPIPKAAFAHHPDVLDVWVVGNLVGLGSDIRAEQEALAACTKAMGSGCKLEGSISSGYVALIRTTDGRIGYGRGATPELAIAEAPKICDLTPEIRRPCEVLHIFSTRTKKYIPDLKKSRKHFAAAAIVAGGQPTEPLWIVSGRATFDEALNDALATCHKGNPGKQCEIATRVGNGFLQSFASDHGRYGTLGESTSARAKAEVSKACDALWKRTCTLQAAYSSKPRREFVHDYVTGKVRK